MEASIHRVKSITLMPTERMVVEATGKEFWVRKLIVESANGQFTLKLFDYSSPNDLELQLAANGQPACTASEPI